MSNRNLKLIIESLVEDILCEDEASKDYIKNINLKQLKKGKRPEPDEDPKQFFSNLQKELEPESERGPIFDKKIIDIIEVIPFKMDKKETQWVANLAKDGHNINLRKLRDMLDFARQTNTDVTKYKNFEEPLAASEEWHEQFKNKENIEDYKSEDKNVVATFGNGYKIVKVPSEDLEAEGDKMGHCVGGYCDVVESGETVIYSLRDKKNEPHVTFEWNPHENYFEQVQGKENNKPVKKYHRFIRDFAVKMGDHITAVDYGHKLTKQDYANIISSGDFDIKKKIALSPKTPKDVLAKLALDQNMSVREYVARNPSASAETLMRLAGDREKYVIKALAKNPATPKEVFVKLANDPEGRFSIDLAKNENTPGEVLAKLVGRGGEAEIVRELVAVNPNTPGEVLAKMASKENPSFRERERVAYNPNTPVEILRELANEDERFHMFLAKNPSTPIDVIKNLAQSPEVGVRASIANRPDIPIEILEALAADKNVNVRISAKNILEKRRREEEARRVRANAANVVRQAYERDFPGG